jgi:hypothetical protein
VGYRDIVRWVARTFIKTDQGRVDEDDLFALGHTALWTVLNNPENGTYFREAISASLRSRGYAHVTWAYSDRGFVFAIGESYTPDLDELAAITPKDSITVFDMTGDTPPTH